MWRENLSQTFKDLTSKEREIIVRRYALDWKKSKPRIALKGKELIVRGETLASIGNSFSITRERVRQLEESVLQKAKEELFKNRELFLPLEDSALQILRPLGGAAEENNFFEKLLGLNISSFDKWSPENFSERQSVSFIFEHLLNQKIEHLPASEDFYSLWKEKNLPFDDFKKNLLAIIKTIALQEKPIPQQTIFETIHKSLPQEIAVSDEVIFGWLSMIKKVRKNIFAEWGLITWPEIIPRRIGDKIDIIFQREKRPVHFRELTKLINELKIDRKVASEGSVRNELIASPKYTLIGRGIYAPGTWGYRSGTVRKIVEDILKEQKRPLKKEEIMPLVLKERQVKETTIQAVLSNKNRFEKLPSGEYTLK